MCYYEHMWMWVPTGTKDSGVMLELQTFVSHPPGCKNHNLTLFEATHTLNYRAMSPVLASRFFAKAHTHGQKQQDNSIWRKQ